MARGDDGKRSAKGSAAGEAMSLAEAAAALGMSVDGLVDLMTEAGVAVSGEPPERWRLEAADVRAVVDERERREVRNVRELEKLGAALEGEDT